MEKDKIPDEAIFFIADGYYSVDQIMRVIYNYPSEKTRSHFLNVNSHLKSRIQPGQMVIITPPDASSCRRWELAMQAAARTIDAELAVMTEQERKALARNYALLSNVATYASPMYGWANNYFAQRADQVKRVLEQIDNLYVSTYRDHGHLRTDHFFSQRKTLLFQLDQAMNGMLKRELFGVPDSSLSLKFQLGISSKSTVHQWKMQGYTDGIKGFETNYHNLKRTAKIFTRLGYVAIGLDVVGGVANVQKACAFEPKSTHCMRARFVEPGKVTGGILGGWAGGFVGYSACNLLFGVESLGSSLLWCGIVAGGAGGYGGAKIGSGLGERVSSEIYEVYAQ